MHGREGIVYAKWTILFYRFERIRKFETENRDLIYDNYNLYHQRILRVDLKNDINYCVLYQISVFDCRSIRNIS